LQKGLHHGIREWPHIALKLSNESLRQATQVCLKLGVLQARLNTKELVLHNKKQQQNG